MRWFLIFYLVFALGLPIQYAHSDQSKNQSEKYVPVGYQRVIESGTLRCGYFVYPPFVIKDLNTGLFSGVYVDIFTEIAKQAGLKIEWSEEVGSDTMFEGLKNGRYDAICAPLTYTIPRAKQAYFTRPFIYVPFYVYVRADDTRFDQGGHDLLNQSSVSFVAKDGDLTEILVRETFPNAQIVSMPGLTDAAMMFTNVSVKKADAIIGEPVYAGIFMRSNPNKIKPLKSLGPVQVVPGTAGVPFGDSKFRQFFDISIQSLLDTGFIKGAIGKYIENADDLFLPSQGYQAAP